MHGDGKNPATGLCCRRSILHVAEQIRRLYSGYCRLSAVYENMALIELTVPNRFFGIRDFPCYLKLGIRDFKGKSGETRD